MLSPPSLVLLFMVAIVKGNIFEVITPPGYFYAPYTPFNNDDPIQPTINEATIASVVDTAIYYGVNIFWIGGSNGQFDAMSVAERKTVCNLYMQAINNHSESAAVYVIFHVGATRIDDAVELAAYAAECGVNAIGSLPPYYKRASTSDSFNQLFSWFRPIINATNGLPFWYYHYPARTAYNINIEQLLTEAITNNGLPELEGIKFNNDDTRDFYQTTNLFSDSVAIVPYYFPTIGIMAMDKGFGYGIVDFMVPVIRCIRMCVYSGRTNDAYWYQNWMDDMDIIAGWPLGQRCLYNSLGPYSFDFGPPRPPLIPYTQEQCDDVISALNDADFFNQLEQIRNDTSCIPLTV